MRDSVITTSYGRPALDALREIVRDAKNDDPMHPVTILVPNNIAGIVARRHLAHGLQEGSSGVAGIHVTTLARLAEQLAAHSLHPRLPTTRPVLAGAWRATLSGQASCFDKVREHPATIGGLVQAHSKLRDLSDGALDRVSEVSLLSADLVRLHREVRDRLTPAWYDPVDLLRTAAELVEAQPASTDELGTIVLHLPQSLTLSEASFARSLAQRGMKVIIGLTGVQRADRGVLRSLRRLGMAEPDVSMRPLVADRVLHASDADDEVRCVVREVAAVLASGTPAHRTAVLYGSTAPYARLLHEHLAAAGLAVNGPATRAVHERAVARGFLGILGLARTNLARRETFTVLAEAPAYDLSGKRIPVAGWERVSRAAGVAGGIDDWCQKLRAFVNDRERVVEKLRAQPDTSPATLEAKRREIDTAAALLNFVGSLHERLEEGRRAVSWAALSAWASSLFEDLYGGADEHKTLPPEEQYAVVAINTALRGIVGLQDVEPVADLTTLVDVVEAQLQSALPRVGRFGEGVFVGPVSAAVGLDLDAAFVVGLAEDGYPGRLHEDALLSEQVRLASDGELDDVALQLGDKQRHLLAALASAPTVTTSFPRGDLRRSTVRLPSRFLLPTLRDITDNMELPATEWDDASQHRTNTGRRLVGSASFADSLQGLDRPACSQEWRVRALTSGKQLDDPVLTAASTLVEERSSATFSRFDGNLNGVAGLPDYSSGDLVVSPTSLETFATCPSRFLFSRLLRVEPLQDPEEIVHVSAADIGTLIHGAMDGLIKHAAEQGTLPSYGEPWSDHHHALLQDLARQLGVELEERGLTGHPRLWQAEMAQIQVDLERMLRDDDAWRAEHSARVVEGELAFGMNGKDALPVRHATGQVLMRGSVDKVDETADGTLLVTDIKSGRAAKFNIIEEDPLAAGTKLQLPVYGYAARAKHGAKLVQAQYWFVRRNDAGKRLSVVLDDEIEAAYGRALAVLTSAIAAGHFPGKPSEKPAWGYVDCPYCTPDGLGHEEARARYVRKRMDPALAPLMALIDADGVASNQDGDHE